MSLSLNLRMKFNPACGLPKMVMLDTSGSCYKLTLYPKWCKDSPSRKQGEWPRFHSILDILTSALFLAQRQAAQT